MRDGVKLLADHFAPVGQAIGTVLSPLAAAIYAVPFAPHGYHVVLVRCRGTSVRESGPRRMSISVTRSANVTLQPSGPTV